MIIKANGGLDTLHDAFVPAPAWAEHGKGLRPLGVESGSLLSVAQPRAW